MRKPLLVIHAFALALILSGVSFGCSIIIIQNPVQVSRNISVTLTYAGAPVTDAEVAIFWKGSDKALWDSRSCSRDIHNQVTHF